MDPRRRNSMNARVAVMAACTVVVIGVWVAVLLQKPQIQADRLPSSGSFPALTTPLPAVVPPRPTPTPGPLEAGPVGAAPGPAAAAPACVRPADHHANHAEDWTPAA